MKIWKNTSTLDGFDEGLDFTTSFDEAEIALMGSKSISINEFKNLKGVFRAGIGKDNVPEEDCDKEGIKVAYPSLKTISIIYDETASFTCSLIFRMLYNQTGSVDNWIKYPRVHIKNKKLLVLGLGNIGSRVCQLMRPFLEVLTYDVTKNNEEDLASLIKDADCITIHIPKSTENIAFFDQEKLSWMKDGAALINTARGSIVDEIALFNELKNHRVRSAFDVFWKEPYNGLLREFYPDMFYMTPHIASTCKEFLQGCREDLDNLINQFNKKL